ncbi:MAG: CYTH domain-containing protein [Pseudomonadota bacterium]
MAQEIELKLSVNEQDIEAIKLLPSFNSSQSQPWKSKKVSNYYFDTKNLMLNRSKSALRIRSIDGKYLQTFKTVGLNQGGVHKRDEWEVSLEQADISLDKFPEAVKTIFSNHSITEEQLILMFAVEFERETLHITTEEGSQVEVAIDRGKLSASEQELPICELELELISGHPEALFKLAETITSQTQAVLDNVSKAEKGFRLLNQMTFINTAEAMMPSQQEPTVEEALQNALQHGLQSLLTAESWILHQQPTEALLAYANAIQFIKHTLSVFSGVISRKATKPFRDELLWLTESLNDVSTLSVLDALEKSLADQKSGWQCPNKSIMHQKILDEMTFLIKGQQVLWQEILTSRRYQMFILRFAHWIQVCGWRSEVKDRSLVYLNQTVLSFAQKYLSQYLKDLKHVFAPNKHLSKVDYYDQIARLEKAMNTGLCFSTLFDATRRKKFRRIWEDILLGIREMKQLDRLEKLTQDWDEPDAQEFSQWLERYQKGLNKALIETRRSALRLKPYWGN